MRRFWDKLKWYLPTYIPRPSERSSSGIEEQEFLEFLQASSIYPIISDLIKSETKRSPISLSIFLNGCEQDFPFQIITAKIQELCEVYIESGRPVELLIGDWFSFAFPQDPPAERSPKVIASLFTALNTESALIVDTGIYQDSDFKSFELYLGYWQKNWQTYTINHQSLDCEDLKPESVPPDRSWVKFRENWLEIIPGLVAIFTCLQLDQHFLLMDFPPLLPQLLPNYFANPQQSKFQLHPQELEEIQKLFAIHYQNLYKTLSPDIYQALTLTTNLRQIQEHSFVKAQVIAFMQAWLQAQNIEFEDNAEIKDLAILMQSAFKLEEWFYIQKLNICLNVINENCQLNLMNILCKAEFEFTVLRLNPQGQVRRSRSNRSRFFCQTIEPDLNLEMVYIPSGIFRMGSPRPEVGHEPTESPMHWVAISTFFIGKYPITQAQWRAIAELPTVNKHLELNPSEFQGNNRPVENVSWHDAVEFCDRLTIKTGIPYRLPTEAEWEYACRAGTKTPFHFGETITSEIANYDGSYPYGFGANGIYRQQTTDVGSFSAANDYGLYDMHGQVLEWCADPWHQDYQNAPTDGSAWYNPKAEADPENLTPVDNRVLRGGSWFNVAGRCRAASRYCYGSDIWLNHVGFRVAISLNL